MIQGHAVILKLIDRYDYGGALELMNEQGLGNTNAAILMDSCRYAVNFDFKTAKKNLCSVHADIRNHEDIKWLMHNLQDLIDGDIDAVFSELLESIKFKIVNEEYIDFLGRAFRCKEAIFKYMFVKKNIGKTNFTFHEPVMQKRNILKMLRKHYKIFNSNVVFAITTYINRSMKEDYKYTEIAKVLNSRRMNDLIELRNESIVGHGFIGVSSEEIYKVYGNPYNVLDDFRECLEKLEIEIVRYKYSKINELIKHLIKDINDTYSPIHTSEKYHFE